MPLQPASLFNRPWMIRAAVCLGLLLSIGKAAGFPTDWRADIPPKFKEPEVTAFAKTLAHFRDHYVDAAQRARRGEDDRRLRKMEADFPQIQAEAVRLLQVLQPKETRLFTEYVARCGQTMVDAAMGMNSRPVTNAN